VAQYASDAPAAALRRRSGLSGLRYAGRHRALELTQPARAPLLVTTAVAPRPRGGLPGPRCCAGRSDWAWPPRPA
jgi:hypothetical protein